MSDDLYKDYKTIKRKPLIIFDLDGTLVDCKGLHQWCFREAVLDINKEVEFADREVEGMPTKDKLNYLRKKGYWLPETVDALKQRYTMEHIRDYVKPNKELRDAIYALTPYYNLSLATNGRKEFVFKVLRIMDLWPWSSFYTPDYGPSKPDTWMYEQCMKSSFCTHHNTMIFEDSPLGIQCANDTGAMVVEVTDANDTLKKVQSLVEIHNERPDTPMHEAYFQIKNKK